MFFKESWLELILFTYKSSCIFIHIVKNVSVIRIVYFALISVWWSKIVPLSGKATNNILFNSAYFMALVNKNL